MNDTTSDFSAYLTPDERVIWQGRNIQMKQNSLLKSMWPVLLGMIIALAAAYYLVFVMSPGSVLYVGLGLDTKASIFVIVLLVFLPFLIRPLWQRRPAKSITLFGVDLPVIGAIAILAGIFLLVFILWQGMAFSLVLVAIVPALLIFMAEDSQRDQNADYVVTNLSALIVPTGATRGKRVTMVPFRNLTGIEVAENRDGTGTLVFGTRPNTTNRTRAGSLLAFWNIERPWDVYQLIRKQIDESANR